LLNSGCAPAHTTIKAPPSRTCEAKSA
jgi:hypothetical protein